MYVYYLYSPAANYGSVPRFMARDEMPKTGFTSLYAISAQDAEAIRAEGTTKGFKGVVWSPTLEMDFDDPEAAERAGCRLEEMGLEFNAFSTGNRGLHFQLFRSLDSKPSHLLPQKDKAWVRDHFPGADTSIYTHLHPFRLEGTKHEKTGRPKQRVHYNPGNKVTVPALKEKPVPTYDASQSSSGRSIFDNLQLMANTIPVHNGERQYTLIRQLFALKYEGVPADMARFWVGEWNKMLSDPKAEEELDKAVMSIYR